MSSTPSRFLQQPALLRCCTDPEPEDFCRGDPSSAHDPGPVTRIPSSSVQIGPAPDASNSEKALSFRSNELKKIKDQLTSGSPSTLKVVPIVGMGGIGKTTLAKSIYEDFEISYHFHFRGWVTISQDYELRNVLLGLLRSTISVADEGSQLANEELAQMLYKNLKGRRFLIVLDDVWNTGIWNDFRWIFPKDNNGSRIILITRLIEVASYVEPSSPPHCLNLLTNKESWRLLQTQVFSGKACPPALVGVGKEIVKKCRGLPLAVVVVAGYLSTIDKKQQCWEDVAKSLDTLTTGNKDNILDILSLSYNYLPLHLKACFLYMGIFPKNSDIHVGKLIRLWSAVGFLESEDESGKCLEDLINRNLIIVKEKKYGTSRTVGIHDLMWDLSFREARKDGNYIFSQFSLGFSQFNPATDDMNYMVNLTSSYVSLERSFETYLSCTSICFRQLLRVLDIQSEVFCSFPETITNLTGLRYLELYTFHIPESISRLRHLETLINRYKGWKYLPKEIWSLRHLRHLQVGNVTLETPFDCNYDLQMLSTVRFDSCAGLAFSRIPNLKQLKICDIHGEEEDEHWSTFFNNLLYLNQLEKLKLHFSKGVRSGQGQLPLCDFFPPNMKQLTLSGSRLQWEDMNILAKLPNIEVLKLKNHAFEGPIYEQTVEGFPRLKVLLFQDLGLEKWIAESIHYPILQHLVLRHCYSLEGVPCFFGEIPTLESIETCSCFRSVIKESLTTIQQEQQSTGNDIQIFSSSQEFCLLKVLLQELSANSETISRDAEDMKKAAEASRNMLEEAKEKLSDALSETKEAKAAAAAIVSEQIYKKVFSEQTSAAPATLTTPAQNIIPSSSRDELDQSFLSKLNSVEESGVELVEMLMATVRADVEALEARENKALKKLERIQKEIDFVNSATQVGLERTAMVEARKKAVEGKIRRWRARERKKFTEENYQNQELKSGKFKCFDVSKKVVIPHLSTKIHRKKKKKKKFV